MNGGEQKGGRGDGRKRGVESKRGERRPGEKGREQERKTHRHVGEGEKGSGEGRVQSSFCSCCDISSHSVFLTDGTEADLN